MIKALFPACRPWWGYVCVYRFRGCSRLTNSSGGEPNTLTHMHMLRGVLFQEKQTVKGVGETDKTFSHTQRRCRRWKGLKNFAVSSLGSKSVIKGGDFVCSTTWLLIRLRSLDKLLSLGNAVKWVRHLSVWWKELAHSSTQWEQEINVSDIWGICSCLLDLGLAYGHNILYTTGWKPE